VESPNRRSDPGSPEGGSVFQQLNHWLYQIERVIVVVSLLVMSVVVFLSVVHRRYADPESVLADKIAKLVGAERDTATWQSLQDAAGPLSFVLLAAIIYLGFRTASRRKLWDRSDEAGKTPEEIHGEPLPHIKCAIYTAITILVAWGVTVLLFGTGKIEQYECIELSLAGEYSFHCGRFPAGLAWAQPLGLILTLWVAFIGASMATRDNLHLKVEAVQQAMPETIKRISGLLSGVLTAMFCLLLAYLGYRYVVVKHEEYVISEGLGGLHDGIAIPYFVSFSIVPIAYVLMALRFVGLGVLAFRGELEEMPAELRNLDQAEEATEAGGASPPDEGAPPPGDTDSDDSDDDGEASHD
jgi:TRAP-type C4-dicarboxylate transport system permease small subunit